MCQRYTEKLLLVPTWGRLWDENLIQGALFSWHARGIWRDIPKPASRSRCSCSSASQRKWHVCPLHALSGRSPAGIHTQLGNHVPWGIVCVVLPNLPWSQEKIYILLWVFNRSQSFPLLSGRFHGNINLTPALTASSHLFTKINLKHTWKNNS